MNPSYSEKFVLKGDWWIKGKEELKSGGEFACGPDGMYLGLYRSIRTADKKDFRLDNEKRIVFGETHSEKFTLVDAWEAGSLKEPNGYQWKSSWRSNVLIIGSHLSEPDEQSYRYGQVSFDALRILLDIGRFRHGQSDRDAAHVVWERGQPFAFNITSGNDRWRIAADSSPICSVAPYKNAEITDFPHFQISTNGDRNVRWFIDKALALRTLLILCCGEPLHLSDLIVFDSRSSTKFRIFVPQTWSTEKPNYLYQLLPLFAVDHRHKEDIFNSFFNLGSEMLVVVGILAATLQQPNTYARTDFINLTQALEGFHRLVMPPGKYIDDDRYEETIRQTLLNAIPSTTDSALKNKLKAILEYGNEFSQRKRFKEAADTLQADFGKLLFNVKTAEFADIVCNTRNAFTHPGSKPPAISEEDCIYPNRGLQLILLLLILRYLGAPTDKFENLEHTKLYRYFSAKRFW